MGLEEQKTRVARRMDRGDWSLPLPQPRLYANKIRMVPPAPSQGIGLSKGGWVGGGAGGGDRETWSFWWGRGGDTRGKGPGLLWRQTCVWRQLFKETRVEEAALPGGACDRAACGHCLLGQAAE